MNVKLRQQNIIKQLPIPLLRETVNEKFECKCIMKDCEAKQGIRKAGFFWSTGGNTYVYHCFKCGTSYNLNRFLREFFREEYMALRVYRNADKEAFEEIQNNIPTIKIENTEIKSFVHDMFETGQIIPIMSSNDRKVWKYVVDRKIPESKYNRLYYTPNFMEINNKIKSMISTNNKKYNSREGEDDGRLMWMFKSITNDVVALQGRKLGEGEPRYLITRFNIDESRLIGGLEFLDTSKRVYVTEGYVDSLFLPNAVSLNGLHFPSIEYLVDDLGCDDVVVVFDNEPSNKEIKRNIKRLGDKSLNIEGLKACLLPESIRNMGKDINDYIKSGLSEQDIINLIEENTFGGSTLKVKSVFW